MNGILIVNKEAGFTSFDVIAKLRGILGMKKIGHTGTLDPMATGVLPVLLGNATRISDYLTDYQKCYIAGVKLGITTDTEDITGTVLSERPVNVTEDALQKVIPSFLGDIMQLTPMYSARKVNGQKLVDLARKGISVEREKKPVCIKELTVSHFSQADGTFTMKVLCSKGTYVRTLCHDIGEALGCGACMTSLQRVRTGQYEIAEAHTLSEIEEAKKAGRIEELVYATDSVFTAYDKSDVTEDGKKFLLNGNPLRPEHLCGPCKTAKIRVYLDGSFAALYEFKNGLYRPDKMFLT